MNNSVAVTCNGTLMNGEEVNIQMGRDYADIRQEVATTYSQA